MSASRILRDKRRERHARVRAALRPKLPKVLLGVWEHAVWVWEQFCWLFDGPRELAALEYVVPAEHRKLSGWIGHLELLTRRLILATALDLDVVLKPLRARDPNADHDAPRKPRQRRRVLVWPEKPETWIARFRMLPRKPPEDRAPRHRKPPQPKPRFVATFPLARRLEALRRVLLAPDARAHRFATRLARIRAANARANLPRLFRVADWPGKPASKRQHGRHIIASAMDILHPILCGQIDWWNDDPEPG